VTERTLVLIKPDGVERKLIGEIISRIERKGLIIAALQLRHVTEALATQHYAEHEGKPFLGSLLEFITSGPLVAAIVEGPRAVAAFRQLAGGTDPVEKATPGTIRGDSRSGFPTFRANWMTWRGGPARPAWTGLRGVRSGCLDRVGEPRAVMWDTRCRVNVAGPVSDTRMKTWASARPPLSAMLRRMSGRHSVRRRVRSNPEPLGARPSQAREK